MAKLDLDALKREITSISAASAAPEQQSQELKSLSRQRQQTAEQVVGQTLAAAGIDVTALRKKLEESSRTFRDAAKNLPKPLSKTLATRRSTFQTNIERRRAALEPFGNIPTTVVTRMVYVPEPFFISMSPNTSSHFVQGTSIAPYDSRMKFFVPSTENGATANCDFWFYWFNDSALQVLVRSASAQVVCNGHIFAYVSAPFPSFLLNFEEFGLQSGASLYVYAQGANGYAGSAYSVGEDFGLLARFSDKQRDLSFEYETLNLATAGFYLAVPPHTGILIRVSPQFIWEFSDESQSENDNGQAGNTFWADFANDDQNYFVQCSGVALEIQTPVVSEPGA